MASKRVSSKKAPWDRPSPVAKKKRPAKHLSEAQKKHAKARAKKAGRPYPNLVDNMHEASTGTAASKKATKRKAATPKKTSTKKSGRKTSAKKSGRKTSTEAAARKSGARKTSAKKTSRKTSAKKTSRKTSAKKTSRKAPTKKRARKASKKSGDAGAAIKDPKGGLTAAGRKAFAARDGSHLKPGVQKRISEMSTVEMRRKGSWAARFYGRDKLPPLVDAHGKPTRFALTAAAWGEPVPRTEAAARRIAAKGRALLARVARR